MARRTTNDGNLTARDVVVFIPNVIGYGRVLSMIIGFVMMIFVPSQWHLAILLYIFSFAGDLFDGWAARRYQQMSTFGGLLDMVTDRIATTGLLFVLSGIYIPPRYDQFTSNCLRSAFAFLSLLDISSHWCQVHSTATLQKHHKSSDGNADRFFLVRWYYQYYYFFGYCCVGAEFTYIALYVLASATQGTISFQIAYWILVLCLPACGTKQLVNVVQLLSACYAVANHDAITANTTAINNKTNGTTTDKQTHKKSE